MPLTKISLLFFSLLSISHYALAIGPVSDTTEAKRISFATRVDRSPIIDGILEPEVYAKAAATGEFTNLEPTFGPIEQWPTTVRVVYNDKAIYIAAEMWYPSVDSVSEEVRPRDEIGNADWFGVAIDPYLSGVNGFEFISVVTGGQFDAILSDNGEDDNWDAVWRNAVQRTDDGWTLEMEIPYSAIRFPEAPIQTWGINFFRRNASAQQKSFWSPIDPNKPGFVPQFGRLEGLRDIKAPARIQLTPFGVVSAADYIDRDQDKMHNFDVKASAGADLKVGLSDAFTLDMSLIPDFSEARQDNQVLNLSPFEVQFSENRPFFTEGVELFNKGGYFYSRRVGGTPLGFDAAYDEAERIGGEVVSNPAASRVLNATKVSGRTEQGTGIGVFNAITGEASATLKTAEGGEMDFVTQPLTNYNVVVVDQLIPNNGFVSLVNTNVLRSGATYDANLTGLVFDVRNKKNTYGLNGNIAVSQIYNPNEKAELGRNIEIEFGDIDGAWSWDLNYEEIGPNWDPSDLGFFRRRNVRELVGSVNHFQAKELGPFNRYGAGLNAGYERYIDPDEYSEVWFNAYTFARTKSNWNINPWIYVAPVATRDRFEPRTEGKFFERPGEVELGGSVRSDQRKPFYFGVFAGGTNYLDGDFGRKAYNFSAWPAYRVSTNLTLFAETSFSHWTNDVGFAGRVDDTPVLGRRDRDVVVNNAGFKYTVTPNLSFNLNARHYWSRVAYKDFYDLDADGGIQHNAQYQNAVEADQTFNALTADLVCRWRFAPGSDLLLVWKDALFTGVDHANDNYFQTWGNNLMGSPRTETISLKVNYFLDWNELRG